MRFIHELFVGREAISVLFAAAQVSTRLSRLVVRCGEWLSQMIAIRTCGGYRLRR
jgi:hypothetical protein